MDALRSPSVADCASNEVGQDELRVKATKVRTAYAAASRNMLEGFGAIFLIVAGMSFEVGSWHFNVVPTTIVWGAMTSVWLLTGLAMAFWFYRKPRPDADSVLATKIYTWNALLAGATWGSCSWLMLPAQSWQQDSLLSVFMALIMMGAVAAQAVLRPVAVAFSCAQTLAYATGLARFGDPFHIIIAFTFVLLCEVLLMSARKQEEAITATVELSLRNEDLLDLRTQQERTARDAQREAEIARERAEKADRAKTAFMAAASHDLRQPMHALIQYVGHLQRNCKELSVQQTVAKIADSVLAMEHLLNAVLDFSKISMGAIKPCFESVDVDLLLKRIDSQIRPLADQKGLAFTLQSERCFAQSDEVLLERIIRNIAENAVNYTEKGSVKIRAVIRRNSIRILISDSGIGISQSEKYKIFEEYYQVGNRARDRRKGLGLGLAIVRELAGMLGVRIKLKTILGRGSTFALDVLRSDEPSVAHAKTVMDDANDYVRGACILLIDDDPMALDGIVTTLSDFGCRVLSASSGDDALHLLADSDFAPHVIIADYRLEDGKTGLEAIEMVAAHSMQLYDTQIGLPALVISGDTSPLELKRVADAGYRMLHKPVGVKKLYSELNSMLEARANLHER